jgi:hypothetical protein
MPAAKSHVVLHDFHTVVDGETGKEGHFQAGEPFDVSRFKNVDVQKLLDEVLLPGHDHKGPLVSEQASAPKPAGADSEVSK